MRPLNVVGTSMMPADDTGPAKMMRITLPENIPTRDVDPSRISPIGADTDMMPPSVTGQGMVSPMDAGPIRMTYMMVDPVRMSQRPENDTDHMGVSGYNADPGGLTTWFYDH